MRASFAAIAVTGVVALAAPQAALAQSYGTARIVGNATAAYLRIMTSDKPIPYGVLRQAIGIAIFPGVTKAGFLVGGTGGEGVLVAKGTRGWSRPAFYRIRAVSYGLQAGIQKADLYLLIMNRKALETFYKPRNTLGNDTAVAAGEEGVKGGLFNTGSAGIITYARVRGIFAGLSLQGARVVFDDDAAQRYYGKSTTGRQLLQSPASAAGVPAGARHLAVFMLHNPRRTLVGAVQQELLERGYYKSSIDGAAGAGTRRAIVAYQKAKGLKVTGVANSALLKHLRTDDR